MSSNELNFCRLCFREDGNISVFEYEYSDDSWPLTDRIFECVSVQISQDDKLPHTVCQPCLQFIIRWCEFKSVCDRNQRTWLLWLRSLRIGSSQETLEGLAENARKKCIELGVRTLLAPEKGAITCFKKSSRPDLLKQNLTVEGSAVHQDHNAAEILKIESTQSLVDFFEKDKDDSSNPKLTNGYVLMDSGSVGSFEKDLRLLSQDSSGNDASGKVSEPPVHVQESCENHEQDRSEGTNEKEHRMETVDDRRDVENVDKEVESALSQGGGGLEDDIPERELALLNGDDPPCEIISTQSDAADSTAQTQSNTVDSSLSTAQTKMKDRKEGTFHNSLLKARLLKQDKCNEVTTKSLPEQPRRPDTPYPHDILRSMAANCKDSQIYTPPTPVKSLSSVQPSFVTPTPVNSTPDITLKPVSLIHSVTKPNPPSSSSERLSESSVSDSASFNLMQIGVSIKHEILSDEGETDDDDCSFNNISIKMEPLDYVQSPLEEVVDAEGPHDLECRYCKLCRKRFNCSQQFFRHLHSQLHKRVSSFAALGHTIDNKVIAQLTREIKSQAYFRGCAKKQMIAMEMEDNLMRDGFDDNGTGEGLMRTDAVEVSTRISNPRTTPSTAVREADSNLLECKVCNVILQSRSRKLKHDSSRMHQQNLEALMDKEAEISGQGMPPNSQLGPPQFGSQAHSNIQAANYTCPFASCGALFGDGGQLIVHMHTHGISLPIHETNKQIQLSQEQNRLNQQTQNCNSQVWAEKRMDKRVAKTEVAPGSSKYTCRRCNRSFIKGMGLSNHLRVCRVPLTRPTTALEKCPVCQVSLKNRRSVLYHIKTYHPESSGSIQFPPADNSFLPRDFPCSVCGKTFTTKNNLNSHVHKVHRKKSSTCKICSRVFSSTSNLTSHYKIHLNMKEGEYLCRVCFEIFQSKRENYLHQKAGCNSNINLFSCTECDFSFRSQEMLDLHKTESHLESISINSEGPLQVDTSCLDDLTNTSCNLCDKVYSSYYNLKRHFRERHMNQASGSTLTPNKANVSVPLPDSPEPSDISEVNNVDDDDKDIQCMYCDAMFTTRKSMIHHMKAICRSVPPKPKCRGCKAERWPWFIGPCEGCGKDLNPPKRKAASIVESLCKKPKLSDVQVPDPSQVDQPKFNSPIIVLRTNKKPKELIFRCPVGKRSFLSQKTMLLHSASCNGTCKDHPVYCKVCHQLYPNPRIYLRHKPCVGKKATQNTSSYQKATDSNRVVKCELCPARFANKNYCYKHMRNVHKHYRRKQPKTIIPAASNTAQSQRPTNLESDQSLQSEGAEDENEHETEHEEPETSEVEDLPTCEACLRTFNTEEALSKHIQNVHKNKFKKVDCSFCSKSIFKRELYEHGFSCVRNQLSNIDTLECIVCSTIFYSNDEEDTISLKLQEHILNCCGKLSTGKGEKFKNKEKFLCLKCCMLFSSKKSLYAHSFERHNILVQTSPTSQSKTNSPPPGNKLVLSDDAPTAELSDSPPSESPNKTSPSTTSAIRCPKCRKSFKTQKGLKCHRAYIGSPCSLKTKVKKTALKCNYCQRQFLSELKLRNHEKVHGIVKEIVMTEEVDVDQTSSDLPNSKLSVTEMLEIVMES